MPVSVCFVSTVCLWDRNTESEVKNKYFWFSLIIRSKYFILYSISQIFALWKYKTLGNINPLKGLAIGSV